MTTKPKRRFLRFSLRTLLLAMLVVCVALGWKVEKARKQRQTVAWIQELGGTVWYDYELNVAGIPVRNIDPPGTTLLRSNLGIDFFAEVGRVYLTEKQVTNVAPLAGLTGLEYLHLQDTKVSNVSPLAGLTKLRELHLAKTQVNDVSPLAGLTSLEFLDLAGSQVNDASPLAGLTRLKSLNIEETPVSDLSTLAGLTNLKYFWLGRTQVTDVSPLAGLSRLELLRLDGTLVSDVTPLARLPLKDLSITNTEVSNVSALAESTSLKELYLSKTPVCEGLEQLRKASPKCRVIIR